MRQPWRTDSECGAGNFMSQGGQALFSPPAWLLSIHNEKSRFQISGCAEIRQPCLAEVLARGGCIHRHAKLTRFRPGSGITGRTRLRVPSLFGGEECPGSHSNSVSCPRTAVLGHQRVREGQSQRSAQCVSHGEQIANMVQGILCLRVVRLSFLRPHGS